MNKEEEKRKRQVLFQRVFDNPDGKEVLKQLEFWSFMNNNTYNPNVDASMHQQSDGLLTIANTLFREGRRSLYIQIKNTLEDKER